MTGFDLQRKTMVDTQIRPSDIADRRILRAMEDVPRELFAAPQFRALAYMDGPLPIGASGFSRAIMAPRTFAMLLDLAQIASSDAVLDAGCGTGYSTAVLAKLARAVTALDPDPALAEEAGRALASLAVENSAVLTGELPKGAPERSPFDVIVLEGFVSEVPRPLFDQLADGGRLVAIVPSGGVARAALWRRAGSVLGKTIGFDASAPALPGFERQTAFAL